ncbi:MAG: hypothetical protein DMD68_01465 [Gemmatimonadetes bacterium]|nr:MAG: hypothetical protein DMD68_01465 [Gemmatimonadota bacterium]
MILLKHLHSDDTPGQVGAGLALGAILGLTPLLNLHNVVVLILIIMLRVSFSGALLGWLIFTPLGFAFDPLFDALGHRLLLETPALNGVWTTLYNTPVVPLTNFNNTVVLGSLAVALALFLPLNALGRFGVRRYRTAVQAWVRSHQPPPPPAPAPGTAAVRRYPPPSRPVRRAGGAGGGIIRWKGTGPFLLFVGLLVGGWLLFADRLAKGAFESVGTAIVGAKVEVGRLHLDLSHGKVSIRGLVVASPDEPLKNLIEADELTADIGVAPLLEKKVVIDRLLANGLRFGTARQSDGRTAGPSDGIKAQVGEFVQRLDVPILQLAVGKVEVGQLDPNVLFTGREALALVARADSAQSAWNAAAGSLDVQAAGDSGVAMAGRLRNAKPTDIGLLADARRTLSQVRQARDRVEAVDRGVKSGIASLQAGAAELAAVRQRDYAIARRVLKVPSLDLPSMGAALFGPAAAARFQRALYWSRVAREYMPAGLLPQSAPGAGWVRRAGTSVRFPREHTLPGFLLRNAELSFILDAAGPAARQRRYAGRLMGLTSSPRLYGRPTTLFAEAPGVRVAAALDHVRPVPRDSGMGTAQGAALPGLDLPSLPLHLAPGQGTVTLSFALVGDSLRGRWSVHTDAARWLRDNGAAAGPAGQVLVERVITGVRILDISARLSGTFDRPSLSVSSNLDRAVGDQLRAVLADEIEAADRQIRARVDSLFETPVELANSRVTMLGGDVYTRVGAQRMRLADAQQQLEQRLRQLTGGILR